MNGLVLGETLWTEGSGVDGMIGIAANTDRASVFDADEHPTADRAVAARRRHPPIWNSLRGRVPGDRIDGVRVPVRQDVETKGAFETEAAHAASFPRYGAARCLGTALTKNR